MRNRNRRKEEWSEMGREVELEMKTVNYVLDAPLSKYYKIALLADTHSKVNPHILLMLQSNNPDMICIAGYLRNTSLLESHNVRDFLKEIVGIAPTFFSFEITITF